VRRKRGYVLFGLSVLPGLVFLTLIVDYAQILGFKPSYACDGTQVIVLGAAQYDGDPSPAFERRLEVAHDLYVRACTSDIIVTGGSQEGDRTTEGDAGVAWLMDRGIPAIALSAETRSTTTAENLRLALPMLTDDEVLIVSDELHLYRAVWVARQYGLAPSTAGAEVQSSRWLYALREALALLSYRLFGV